MDNALAGTIGGVVAIVLIAWLALIGFAPLTCPRCEQPIEGDAARCANCEARV